MDKASIRQYILDTFASVDVIDDSCTSFFFYEPDRKTPPDHKFPFATLVTTDLYDQFSNLNRPSVFRLNIGISKQTYLSLFGSQTAHAGEDGGHDFTALDVILPHPVYGKMYWVCVLNPSAETFRAIQPLLAEAYDLFVKKGAKARTATES